MLIGEYVSEPQNPGSVFVGGSGLLKPGSRHDRSSKAIRETLPRQRYKLPVLSFARDQDRSLCSLRIEEEGEERAASNSIKADSRRGGTIIIAVRVAALSP